jgi:O-antigen ligase
LLWIKEGHRRLTSKWFWMTLAMLAGLVLTFTFGAWLALAATCGFAILRYGGRKKWKYLFGGGALLLIAAAVLAFGPLRSVIMEKASGVAMGSLAWDAATRLYGWKLALQLWWAHPLIGAGIGNYASFSAGYDFVLGAQSQGSSPHNTYLYLLSDYGLAGFIAVLAVLIGSIRSNLCIARKQTEIALVGAALAFAITMNMIGWVADDSGFLGPHASYLLWLFVGLSGVIVRLSSLPSPSLNPAHD